MQRPVFLAAGTLVLLLDGAYSAHAQTTIVYSNETNFTGYAVTNGGATSGKKNTYMVADDINTLPIGDGQGVTSLDFSLANQNAGTAAASPILNFYATNGTGGNPGTLLGSVTLTTISAPSGVSLYTYTPTSGTVFIIPASGSFWAGITFTSTGTAATLNKFGQGLFNPPTVGTSQDLVFETNGTGTFEASNPAGAQYAAPFEPTAAGNFGWQFSIATPAASAAPEPSAWATLIFSALGIGGLCLKARKRQAV